MRKPDTEGKVLLGNVVRPFLDAGGTLRYHPIRDEESGKTHWLVFGVRSDGSESQVFISRNGEPKRIRSANAVLSYHQSMFPDDKGVFIPWIPGEDTQGADFYRRRSINQDATARSSFCGTLARRP